MPYKSEKIKIAGTSHDRRIKLTPEQRVEIRHMHEFLGTSYNSLARMYSVSKRLIQFVCCPEKEEAARQRFRELRADGRYYHKEKHTEAIRDCRRHKQSLFLKGQITLE